MLTFLIRSGPVTAKDADLDERFQLPWGKKSRVIFQHHYFDRYMLFTLRQYFSSFQWEIKQFTYFLLV